ncbi:MAG: hypothetical protein U0176_24645 [Bacteroidia bacterium]
MEERKIEETFTPDAGKQMLAHLLVVVAALVAVVQIVIFFAQRWQSISESDFFGHYYERIFLNPLIIWCPLWILILFGIWLWNGRRFRIRFHLPTLIISLLVASAFTAWGLALDPPISKGMKSNEIDLNGYPGRFPSQPANPLDFLRGQ